MRHILSVLVLNKPGVLSRIASLFSRRNFNIDSLNVGQTENSNLSRMTIVVNGNEKILEQVVKNLHKLIDVIKISELKDDTSVNRDLALISVYCPRSSRSEIIQIADTFRAKIVDVSYDSLMVEVTGTEDKINAIIELLKDFGIQEIVRTGIVALSRGQIQEEKNEKIS
jgi:acetolactate synthase I/III small subunit